MQGAGRLWRKSGAFKRSVDKRRLSPYTGAVIRKFRHRGLEQFYNGNPGRISPELRAKVERVLDVLNVAEGPRQVDLPGYRLHALKGDLCGLWSITISGNWRIIFRFVDSDVSDIDLVDYH